METSGPDTLEAKKTQIPLDEDFEFSFKPITEGLGFNQKREVKPVIPKLKTTVSARNRVAKLTPEITLNDGLLDYYRKSDGKKPAVESTSQKLDKPLTKKPKLILADWSERLLAFIVDFFAVVSLGVLTQALCALNLMNDFGMIQEIIQDPMYWVFSGWLLLIFYFLYFTFAEVFIGSTVGKGLFGIRLVNKRGETPSFSTVFWRTVVSFTSCLALGLPLLINLHDKLSDTTVVKS